MIIDSHAHYTNNAYTQNFRYLTRNVAGYALSEGDRQEPCRRFQHTPEKISQVKGVHHEENRCHQLQSPDCLEYCSSGSGSRLDAGLALAQLYVSNEETFRFFKAERITDLPEYGYIGSCGL